MACGIRIGGASLLAALLGITPVHRVCEKNNRTSLRDRRGRKMEELSMRPVFLYGIACAVILSTVPDALAQTPYGQSSQGQYPYAQMPFMQGMQELDEKHRKIEAQRKQERKVITDRIYAEELAKAQQGNAPDPYAASEWAAKQGLQPIHAQWETEDQELEVEKHQEMMNSTGMGDMLRQQQNMMKQYGQLSPYPAP